MSLDDTNNNFDLETREDSLQIKSTANKGKILLFSYAFPPMQVQMTPAVCKPMAAMVKLGYEVDVVCADSFSPHLATEDSLLPYVNKHFVNIHRLKPDFGQRQNILSHVPDLMAPLHRAAFRHLMDIDLSEYKGVMTWSPFHSINSVMVRVKKQRKNLRWIAQFSDPWAGNPLEVRHLNKLWNQWHEPATIKNADYLIHSSPYSLDLMLRRGHSKNNTLVLPHVFTEELYPQRAKSINKKIILRYLGVLYGRRSPEPLFLALNNLLEQHKELRDSIQVELIGYVPPEMLQTKAILSLPKDMVRNISNVNYVESLQLMYDADILLLIEADISKNLFLPSKLSDYLGANTPIVGMVPPGSSEDIMQQLNCWYSRPADIDKITDNLKNAIDYVNSKSSDPWCNEVVRNQFSAQHVGTQFSEILESIQ